MFEPGKVGEIECKDLDPGDAELTEFTRAGLIRAGLGAAAAVSLLGSMGVESAWAVNRRRGVTRAVARSSIGKGKTIALSLNGFNTYDQNLATGVLHALAGTQYKFIGAQANFTSTAEVTNIQSLLSQNPAGLLIIPNTVAGASRGALQAKRAGIPVVNLLWSGKTPADSAYIGVVRVDNTKGGGTIADYLGKKVKKGKILVVIGVPGQGFSEEITTGLKHGLAKYPQLSIAGLQPGFFTAGPAVKAVQNMLTAHPDAVAIVDYAAGMGDGIAAYLKARKITHIEHVTSDGDAGMLPWLKQGTYITADRYYSSAQEGVVGAMIMRNFLEKDQKPKSFVTELYQAMVTKSNLAGQPALGYYQYYRQVKKIA
jgi:ribose transport system substrate-binding protein